MFLLTFYGLGVLVMFAITFVVLNWGSFRDPIIMTLNMSTAAVLAVLWPMSLVYLLISIGHDVYERFRKD